MAEKETEQREEKEMGKSGRALEEIVFWFVLGLLVFSLIKAADIFGFWNWKNFIIDLSALFVFVWYYAASTNRFFTFVKEGTVKVVVKGDAAVKALIQWRGHTLIMKRKSDPQGKMAQDVWDVIEGKEWHLFGGLRYYGFYPIKDIYTYWFQWSGVSEDGKVVHHPPELLDFIILKDDVYWALVDKAEDKNLLPLEIELLLTVRIINPYKALFVIQNWLETTINRVKPAVRPLIPAEEYNYWIKKKEFLGEQILEKTGALRDELAQWYGIEIKKTEVKDINPPEGYREKTLAPYFADLEKQTAIIKAEGEKNAAIIGAEGIKQATVIKAEGEEERIEKVFNRILKFGDLGKLVRTLEAVEKSPLAASLTVQAIPGLPEILRGVFGRPPGEITSGEFRRLRETVEKMARQIEELGRK